MAEVATRLGYEDPSNFSRTCQRWLDRAPGAMRGQPRARAPGSVPLDTLAR